MKFLLIKPIFLLFICIFSCFFFPLLCSEPRDDIAYCLSKYNVNNFTLFPNNNEDPTLYFNFLYLSIQNLRFIEPSFAKPIAIVMPESKDELVNAVRCCRDVSFEIQVRSGGHSYEGTSSVGSAPFVIIDMINLSRVNVDLEAEVAWVEGGATLGQTYYAIAESDHRQLSSDREYSYGFSAGSCPTVGVGGHIAGGGFGLLSRKYGVAADNVVDALLIDADGRLLDRKSMGEEVFWAIRGGGGGIWGIVYAWKIQLLKVPKTVTSFIVSRPGTKDYVSNLVHKWQYVAPNLDDEFYLSVFVGGVALGIGISSTFNGFYLGSKINALAILHEVFPELDVKEVECKESSWIESTLYFSGLVNATSIYQLTHRYDLQNKLYFKAKSDYVKTPISYTGITSAIEILEKEPKGYVILDPYGGFMQRTSSDSIAFPHRKDNLFSIQYRVDWKEDDNNKSDIYIAWIRGFYNSMTPYVSSDPRAAYVNYMDLDLGVMDSVLEDNDCGDHARVWGEKYFLKNYDRLVRAKTLIDPLNLFRNQQGISPMAGNTCVRSDV